MVRLVTRVCLCFFFSGVVVAGVRGDELSIDALRAVEAKVVSVVERASPATVAVQIGDGTGSGVIVSPDGLVLSVAHVTGAPGQRAAVHFADGSVAVAETLGLEGRTDCGMLRLLAAGPWPYVEMASEDDAAAALAAGDFIVALGHPGGYEADRPVVARVGRVTGLEVGGLEDAAGSDDLLGGDIRSDAPLIAGDSGGPLLDLAGRVVGIHTRIGSSSAVNFHVPVSRYAAQWETLVAGGRSAAWLGAVGRDTLGGFRVGAVEDGSPAAAAGLVRGDMVVAFNGMPIEAGRPLRGYLSLRRAGESAQLRVQRRGQDMMVSVQLEDRPSVQGLWEEAGDE